MNKLEEKTETQEKIFPREIEEEMKQSYIDYSMSVIISRALPDVRDGLNLFIEGFFFQCMGLDYSITSSTEKAQEL